MASTNDKLEQGQEGATGNDRGMQDAQHNVGAVADEKAKEQLSDDVKNNSSRNISTEHDGSLNTSANDGD